MKNIFKNLIFVLVFLGILSIGAEKLYAASPSIISGSASSITTNSATLNGVVNPNGEDTTVWFETTSGGPFQIQNIGNGITDVSLLSYNLTGLTPNTTYTFKIVAGNASGSTDSGLIFSFTTDADPIPPVLPSPSIISNTTTNITSTSATLNGVVNPNGYSTTAWFETPSSGPLQVQNIGNGTTDISLLSYNLTGLDPSTTYTFKIITGSANGSVDSGWISFTTNAPPVGPVLLPPTIISSTTTNITSTGVTLNGLVNPNGYTTTAWFETPSGGPFQLQNIGNANSSVTMLAYNLTGLTPSTNYTFKIKAGNANGSVDSGWVSFTTASSGGGGGCGLVPTITSLSPSSVTAGAGATLVTITGTNFVNGISSALFNGIARTTNFINGTSLTVNLIASDVASAGTGNITVANGACASGSSTFTINATVPTGGGSSGGGGGVSFMLPAVITQNATKVTSTGATLNGTINPNGFTANMWFEYGISLTLVNTTETTHITKNPINSTLNEVQDIVNLKPDTTYYFRIIGKNTSGTVKGSIFSFKTLNDTTTKTTTIDTTPKVSVSEITKTKKKEITKPKIEEIKKDSNIDYSEIKTAEIEISTMKEDVAIKDEINYSITFKNLIEKNLENIRIIVHLPKEIDFKESNIGILGDDNTVILNSEILFPNQTSTLIIKGVVNSNASLQKIITTTVSATYNVAGSNLEKEESSFITNYIVSNILLQASSILSLSYMPYWIGLIALILIIIGLTIFGKKIYKSKL